MTRRRRRSKRQGPQVNPLFGYLLFIGVGLGTWRVAIELRHLLGWLILLIAALLYVETRPLKANYTLSNVGWGALAGALLGLPILIFGWQYLVDWPVRLYGTDQAILIIYQIVFMISLVEELFFRGFAQREMGLWPAVGLYAGYALIAFLPNESLPLQHVLAVAAAYAIVGFMQSYVYRRHGLAAAMSSHIMLNLLVFALPATAKLIALAWEA